MSDLDFDLNAPADVYKRQVQHSGGKPVLGVKIIAFAQRDIRQVLFLDGPQCRTAAGGFLLSLIHI